MSRYSAIIPNDVSNGEGVCVSFFVQGCPHHCEGCFNPETWDFEGGKPYTIETKWEIIKAISANGIERSFSVLGGEPLALNNLDMVDEVITAVRTAYPEITIYLWTGFIMSDLVFSNNSKIKSILSKVDYVIDGPFKEELKNLDLKWRGSINQNIWGKINGEWRIVNGRIEGEDRFLG